MKFLKILALSHILLSGIFIYFIFNASTIDKYTTIYSILYVVYSLIVLEIFAALSVRKNDLNIKLREELDALKKENGNLIEKLNEKENVKTDADAREIESIKIDGNNEEEFFKNLLSFLSKKIGLVEGLVYKNRGDLFEPIATYAFYDDLEKVKFKEGEGINGQVVKDKKLLILTNVPDGYVKVFSGLGESKAKFLVYWPVIKDDKVLYLIEFATFSEVEKDQLNNFLGELETIVQEKEF